MVALKDRWMSGRVFMLTRHEGYSWKDAVIEAARQWDEQETLSAK